MKKAGKEARTKLSTLTKSDRQLPRIADEELRGVGGAMTRSYPPWGGPNDYVFDNLF